ncbi:hypothetical protein ACJX0J_029273, partial [Zea mays]
NMGVLMARGMNCIKECSIQLIEVAKMNLKALHLCGWIKCHIHDLGWLWYKRLIDSSTFSTHLNSRIDDLCDNMGIKNAFFAKYTPKSNGLSLKYDSRFSTLLTTNKEDSKLSSIYYYSIVCQILSRNAEELNMGSDHFEYSTSGINGVYDIDKNKNKYNNDGGAEHHHYITVEVFGLFSLQPNLYQVINRTDSIFQVF